MKEKIKKLKDIPLNGYRKIIRKIIILIIKNKSFINLGKQFIVAVIAHGILVNYMLWSLFKFNFSIYTLTGYGILVYLLKEEFVSFIRRIIFKK